MKRMKGMKRMKRRPSPLDSIRSKPVAVLVHSWDLNGVAKVSLHLTIF